MRTTIYKIRHYLKLNKILPFGFILLLTSCFYSGKYLATYTVQSKQTDKDVKEISIDFINQLADKNSLSKDSSFKGIDTLGFYGQPYHYFKFWFEERDSITVVKVDYWGTFGNRKHKPYADLFNELNEFMKEYFLLIEENIKEENNAKTGKY